MSHKSTIPYRGDLNLWFVGELDHLMIQERPMIESRSTEGRASWTSSWTFSRRDIHLQFVSHKYQRKTSYVGFAWLTRVELIHALLYREALNCSIQREIDQLAFWFGDSLLDSRGSRWTLEGTLLSSWCRCSKEPIRQHLLRDHCIHGGLN